MRDFRYERRLMRRRPPRRRWAAGCFWLVAVTAVLAVAVGYLVISPREHAPVLTGPDRDRVESEVEQVRSELRKLKADARAGVRRPFHLTVTDEQLNYLLSEDPKVREQLQAHAIEEAWVRMEKGTIVATAVRNVGGIPVQVRAVLVPELAGERSIHARIVEMHLGRLGAPRAAVERLADRVGYLLTSQVMTTNVRLEEISVQGSAVHLRGFTGSGAARQ